MTAGRSTAGEKIISPHRILATGTFSQNGASSRNDNCPAFSRDAYPVSS